MYYNTDPMRFYNVWNYWKGQQNKIFSIQTIVPSKESWFKSDYDLYEKMADFTYISFADI